MSDNFNTIVDGPKQFARECTQLINRCSKPDRREFVHVSRAVAVGFFFMGIIGYLWCLIRSIQ
ncbi:hypothetical protein ROZALSC1DRAFT_31486 [Rozella allomycis CSF55]|uniref:Protein translocase complex, SecE/Sec61-gamma subunit domain-containing protein n=1 Tax=Rozella allomycis (strain CSF55) TaxID=988480 RepID=A0A075APG3_ROZAC|nr:Protein translocase complex, SecE/Sec61-gamma subunit domain-containing protein [Rozella allomycis CSF55]RKP16611.1 hypothetical protein ROZALSC1DRAFT_31486 [Rozella allomycis CSF55]|eukprot:EPZ31989.1 Protein translocase complex, SecE/Sec61-gamma subunit domain-containing protein [Rozella allomycis CSF55]